jgi:hypothetical protein
MKGEGYAERVYEGKCSRKITNSCMKMEKMRHVEIIP